MEPGRRPHPPCSEGDGQELEPDSAGGLPGEDGERLQEETREVDGEEGTERFRQQEAGEVVQRVHEHAQGDLAALGGEVWGEVERG